MAESEALEKCAESIFPTLLNTDSFTINAFDMHLIFILVLALSSVVGIWVVYFHYRKLFLQWIPLFFAFIFIGFIAVGELLEHMDVAPTLDFWHHVHLAAGAGAIYYFYYFTRSFRSDLKRQPGSSPEGVCTNGSCIPRFAIVIAIVLASAFFATFGDDVLGLSYNDVGFANFALLTIASMALLIDTLQNMRQLNAMLANTFSLKIFLLTSAVYTIICALFLLVVDVNILGLSAHWPGTRSQVLVDITTMSRIFQNMFYIIMASSMLFFSFATVRADSYYAPISAFLSKASKGEKKE